MQEGDHEPLLGDASGGVGGAGARQRTTNTSGAATSAAAAVSSPAPPPSGNVSRSDSATNTASNNNNTSIVTKIYLLFTLLVKILFYPLRKMSQLAFPPGPYDGLTSATASDRAARDFVALFRTYLAAAAASSSSSSSSTLENANTANVSPPQNPFSTEGYRATLADVASTSSSGPSPLLLVYLHAPHHPDCGTFCRRTLANNKMIRYLNDLEAMASGTHGSRGQGMRCFGASVQSADGRHLAQSLGAAAYPFLCLVNVKSRSGSGGGSSNSNSNRDHGNYALEVYLRMQGRQLTALSPDTVLAYLQTVMRQHGAAAAEVESRRLQREEEALLRQEQDREYREALEADRAREAARQAEREKEEAAQREREEAERQAQEEKEDGLAKALSMVGDEPSAGTADTARIRLTLPNGRRIDRRFHADDTIEVVRAFLIVHFHENGVDIANFCCRRPSPRERTTIPRSPSARAIWCRRLC